MANFPTTVPIFPLHNVLLLPGGQLPLQVFEPRYLALTDHSLANGRYIGIIQYAPEADHEDPAKTLYSTGTLGKITAFEEHGERYFINIEGVCRFDTTSEVAADTAYRHLEADYQPYQKTDTASSYKLTTKPRDNWLTLVKQYFKQQSMQADWEALQVVPMDKLITTLAMACPLSSAERQALLQAETINDCAAQLYAMLDMAVRHDQLQGSEVLQ